jgi:hypothetical protein
MSHHPQRYLMENSAESIHNNFRRCSITDTMTTDTFTVEGEKTKISLDFR